MAVATVTSKGQVTIPKKIRKALHIEAGDRVDFVLEEGSRVILRTAGRDIMDLYGLLHRPGRRPLTLRQMDRAVRWRHRNA